MNCPECKANASKIIDSVNAVNMVHRRRKCLACDHRWDSIEFPVSRVKQGLYAVEGVAVLVNCTPGKYRRRKTERPVD